MFSMFKKCLESFFFKWCNSLRLICLDVWYIRNSKYAIYEYMYFTLNCDNKYKCLNVIMYVCIYVFKDAVKEFPLVG